MTDERNLDRKLLLPLSVMFLLCCIHFYCLFRYAINVPFSDDYNEILKNMNMILDSGSVGESARQILHGNGYSKPITVRLITLLHNTILHEINFKYLVYTGNLFLLATCIVFIRSTLSISRYLIVTIACFVFQPQYWEAIYQSTLSNSVFPCLFFSLAAIYCITRNTTCCDAVALLLAVLAQISFGNGFLVYPILLMVAVYRKNIRLCAAILVVLVGCTYLYLTGTTVSYSVAQQMGVLTRQKLSSVWLLEFIGSALGYAFGSGYDHDLSGRVASIVIGGLVVLFYLYLIGRKYYKNNILLFSMLTFFILTALLASQLRFTTEVPGASRYQIQSALCILTVLIVILDRYASLLNRYVIIGLTVVFPLLFVLVSYTTNLTFVVGHKTRLAAGMLSWKRSGSGLTIWQGQEAAGQLLFQSSQRGLYRIPFDQELITAVWKR